MATKPKAGKTTAVATRPKVVALDTRRVTTGDRLANVFTSMNMPSGRRGGDEWTYCPLDFHKLSDMYRGDWAARKVVDIVADDMTSSWRAWSAEEEKITAIEKAEVELDLVRKATQALRWARLFGGGAIIIGTRGDSSAPLNFDTIAKGGIKYLIAVPRTRLTVDGMLQWDPNKPNFGLPDMWQLQINNGPQVRVHWSRVIIFRGAPYPDATLEPDPWGESILQSVHDALRDANIANTAGASLLEEAKVDVLQMENLAAFLSTEDSTAKLMERLRLFQLGKSNFRTLLMGAGEEYSSKTVSFGNVDKVLTYFMQVVSGAADIPMTRFLAQSPAGLSSTGDSDMRNYAGMIAAQQQRVLQPEMLQLDKAIQRHATGDFDDEIYYEWKSIWEMSPKEAADTNFANAQADSLYAASALVPMTALEKAVQNRMEESGMFPGLADAIDGLSPAEMEEMRPEPAVIPVDPNKLPPGGLPANDPSGAKANGGKQPPAKKRPPAKKK